MPACLCEYPAATTQEYLEAVPLLEEPCQDDHHSKLRLTHVILACAVVLVEIVRALRSDPERSQQKGVSSQQNNMNPLQDDEGDQPAPMTVRRSPSVVGGRRSSRINELQHLKRLEDTGSAADVIEHLRIKNLGIAIMMAGLRVPSASHGTVICCHAAGDLEDKEPK